jgi:hypothetical protein
MKGETAEQVAERMRAIAASMSDKGDAAEIVRYADWLVGRRYTIVAAVNCAAPETVRSEFLCEEDREVSSCEEQSTER